VVTGDAAAWTWTTDGRRTTFDNPLLLANRKAKRLASLLRRQEALTKGRVRQPWIEAILFLSDVVSFKLDLGSQSRTFGRGRPGHPNDDGIINVLENLALGPATQRAPVVVAEARAIARAISQAGIRPSVAQRRVGDYELGSSLGDGEGWQDFLARHVGLGIERRLRLYPYAQAASPQARESLVRRAAREFKVLEGIDHPGILGVREFKESELGPALIFEHHPNAVRLDHYIQDRHTRLSVSERFSLLRQLAEAVQYAHSRRLHHRLLSPQIILVRELDSNRPRVQILDWQGASRTDAEAATPLRTTGTLHLDEYVADPARVYLAPEASRNLASAGEVLDVFGLGAVAYFLFAGKAPAGTTAELIDRLARGDGLRLSEVVDGVGGDLEDLIRIATAPAVGSRIATAAEFLAYLADAEKEGLTEPDPAVVDPSVAEPGQEIDGGFRVVRRLGRGSTSDVLLVHRDGENRDLVLKVAVDAARGARVQAESETLARLPGHPNIVRFIAPMTVAGWPAILIERAGEQTLAQELKSPTPPSLDLLRRYGDDLLTALVYLEEEGVAHRDIKPENIGIAVLRGSKRKRLVLFDFSLARVPVEELEAGTRPYLDPFLPLRRPPRWDLHAERFAAAMTLHEMLTGVLPVWGDGQTDPVQLEDEVPRIERERFDPALADGLTRFFSKAFRRDPGDRYGNAEDMLRAWRLAFEPADRRAEDETSLEVLAPRLRPTAAVTDLGLGIEALNVLTSMGVDNVQKLLAVDRRKYRYLPNVGDRIRKEIRLKAKLLAQLRPDLAPQQPERTTARGKVASLDQLFGQLLPQRPAGEEPVEDRVLETYLGLTDEDRERPWPALADVARRHGVARSRVAETIERARERWHKNHAFNQLRDEIASMLSVSSGVAGVRALALRIRDARGTRIEDSREEECEAQAVLRAAVELEAGMAEPRFRVFDSQQPWLVAKGEDEALYAWVLGEAADRLAAEDPVPTPERAERELAAIGAPHGYEPMPATRLLSLAAEGSQTAAVTSRLELYQRGMSAEQALRLAIGALTGPQRLTLEQVRERIRVRFPLATALPGRPELDSLLEEAGAGRSWQEHGERGPGYYLRTVSRTRSGTLEGARHDTTSPAVDQTSEVLQARAIEGKLANAAKQGGFLVLTCEPRHLTRAEDELLRRFPLQRLSIDRLEQTAR
jgi:serine/threonine protein kinase